MPLALKHNWTVNDVFGRKVFNLPSKVACYKKEFERGL